MTPSTPNTTPRCGSEQPPPSPLEIHLRALHVSRIQRAALMLPRDVLWAASAHARATGSKLSTLVTGLLEAYLEMHAADLWKEKQHSLAERQADARAEFETKTLTDSKLLKHLTNSLAIERRNTETTTPTTNTRSK